MLVTCQQMSEAERRLFSDGVSPEPFMDEAGRRCAFEILSWFDNPGHAKIYCGKGNNAGDALVVARWLKRWGWRIDLNFSHRTEDLSALARKKLGEFENEPSHASPFPPDRLVLVDGLLGIGARGDLRGPIRELADEINTLRQEAFGTCFAIDIPTGLNADTGVPGAGAVHADFTLSITLPKAGFAADEALDYVGRLVEIPLPIPVDEVDRSKGFLFPSNLRNRLPRRNFDTHKGHAGRVTVVAGSRGMIGAAALTALGASRAGAGLVTVCVPEDIYPIVASQCPLEVMVRAVRTVDDVEATGGDVVAIGPGMGGRAEDYLDWIASSERKMVVDADALNALGRAKTDLSTLAGVRILTPHPGELARLTDETGDRVSLTRRLADKWGVTLLHKGARTAVASPGKPVELNTTGTPGMASGGMGDVLTGLCAALLGQGLQAHDAACVGSWLLGRAAELACRHSYAACEAVSAPEVAGRLGQALLDLQSWDPDAEAPEPAR